MFGIESLNCYWESGCEPELTDGNAGIDLRAKETVVIEDKVPEKVGTGFYVEIPKGFAGFLMPRSSSGKTGLKLANTVGLIDPTYRGEVIAKVCKDWQNYDDFPLEIERGERFCQLVIVPYLSIGILNHTEQLSETLRGIDGFGSTGRF